MTAPPSDGTARPSSGPSVDELTAVPRTIDGTIDLDAVHAALAPADLLETAAGYDGWSYVVPHLGSRLVDDGSRSWWRDPDGRRRPAGTDPFAAIGQWCERHGIDPNAPRDADLPPFTGGLVGAFAYDLARRIERLPVLAADDRDAAHLSLRVAEVVVAIAPRRDRAVVVARDLGASDAATRGRRVADVRDRVASSRPAAPLPGPHAPTTVTTSLPRPAYLRAVEAVLEHIAAGDAFQVNLTQRLTVRSPATTEELYRRLRDASPAPYGAALPDVGVASVSPETFVQVDAGRVTVRPIKGTRPRHPDPDLDAANADDLATSAKDRAENVMIVDLERNDLGRVCVPATIHVPRLCAVEAHPTVWHLVSDVAGRLGSAVGYDDLLRAVFPCGSITGAPKVSAMGIVETLEPVRRGWYCGAVGYLGAGAASLSVAIRTATRHPDGYVDHGVGGGIVADSDPVAEHTESLDKAAAFLRAVDGRVASPTGR